MAKTRITEKTLELNICEELLRLFRKEFPRAFWYGPSLQDEHNLGYDAALHNADGRFLFIQFKRPLDYPAADPKAYPYWFKIQTRQNSMLLAVANEHPRCVYYAFPFLGDHDELTRAIPQLVDETNFTLVEVIGELDGESHDVEAYPDHVNVHSPINAPSFDCNGVLKQCRALSEVPFTTFAHIYDRLIQTGYTTAPIPALEGARLVEVSLPQAVFLLK